MQCVFLYTCNYTHVHIPDNELTILAYTTRRAPVAIKLCLHAMCTVYVLCVDVQSSI